MDVTRSSVQKSVCVLSRVPLFGVLTAKLQLITKAYFNERDFAKASFSFHFLLIIHFLTVWWNKIMKSLKSSKVLLYFLEEEERFSDEPNYTFLQYMLHYI